MVIIGLYDFGNLDLPLRREGWILVFEKIRDIICDQLDLDEEKVTMESSVTDDLAADSLDIVDIVMTLEEEFDLEIPDDAVETIKTVGDLVRFIEDHVEE